MKTVFGALCLIAVLGASSAASAITLPDGGSCSSTGAAFAVTNTNSTVGSTAITANHSTQIAVLGTTNTGTAVEGISFGTGTAVWGDGGNGIGVRGRSSSGDGGEFSTGGFGKSAIWAHNDNASGGYGVAASANSNGVGVQGVVHGTGVGVQGVNSNGSGWAGYFDGKLFASSGYKPGGGSWTASSDARLKKDIQPLSDEEARAKLMALKPVTFKWKNPESQGNRTWTEVGFIAQDVEKVFPHWVGVDGKGMKTLTITGFEAYMVQVAQAQERRIAQLEQRPVVASVFPGVAVAIFGALAALAYAAYQRRRKSAKL